VPAVVLLTSWTRWSRIPLAVILLGRRIVTML